MSLALPRRWSAVALLVLLALIAGETQTTRPATGPVELQTASSTAWAPSSARPFSDPMWFPLRKPARVSCTYRNCLDGAGDHYHGYWAMDFLGAKGDPVHAAGAGVFHIGANDRTCRTTGNSDSTGIWVWIDHGGGVVSRYHHLDSITAREGQLVTPATMIGRMGSTGDHAPCTTNYLHFEVRKNGVKGTHVDPGQLFACEGSAKVSYPRDLGRGYTSWNHLVKVAETTPVLTNACMPASTVTTSVPTGMTAKRGDRSATLSWAAPTHGASSVNRYVLSREMYGPSFKGWHQPVHTVLPATQRSLTVTGLDNGRVYRWRITAHNSIGHSPYSGYAQASPAAAPQAPATDRTLTAGSTYIRFGWHGSVHQGTPVTHYSVRIRHWDGSAWTPWTQARTPGRELTYRWDGLRRGGTTYQVTARAESDAGPSPWGTARKLVTLP